MEETKEPPRGFLATFWANASYKSFAKSYFREGDGESSTLPVSNYDPSRRSSNSNDAPLSPVYSSMRAAERRTPSNKFTTHQLLYIFGSHGIGAMIISGGINFAIAYAMYTRSDNPDPIRLFQLPNTLAGDTAVTVILQTIITWIIEMLVVNGDLRKANIRPIGFITEPEPVTTTTTAADGSTLNLATRLRRRALRWFLLLDLPKQQRKRRGSLLRQARYLLSQVLRAFVVAVVVFPFLFGPSVGILTVIGVPNGGDWEFPSRWTPEVFKLVLGAVLALLTSPFFAMFWMVKCGWNGGIHEAVMISGNETK